MSEMIRVTLAGRKTVFSRRDQAPVFLWAGGDPSEEEINDLYKKTGRDDFSVFSFGTNDWDGAYSPWPAVIGENRAFSGQASTTLLWLKEQAGPYLEKQETGPLYMMGYSLAGLFALFSLYEWEQSAGAVCCSSSLWYPEWMDYARTHSPFPGKQIYLSLGGREAASGEAIMRGIEQNTREQEKLLKGDRNVKKVCLRMVAGGHFADSVKRLAMGVNWLLNNVVSSGKEI